MQTRKQDRAGAGSPAVAAATSLRHAPGAARRLPVAVCSPPCLGAVRKAGAAVPDRPCAAAAADGPGAHAGDAGPAAAAPARQPAAAAGGGGRRQGGHCAAHARLCHHWLPAAGRRRVRHSAYIPCGFVSLLPFFGCFRAATTALQCLPRTARFWWPAQLVGAPPFHPLPSVQEIFGGCAAAAAAGGAPRGAPVHPRCARLATSAPAAANCSDAA